MAESVDSYLSMCGIKARGLDQSMSANELNDLSKDSWAVRTAASQPKMNTAQVV